jgi:hypothetical protein
MGPLTIAEWAHCLEFVWSNGRRGDRISKRGYRESFGEVLQLMKTCGIEPPAQALKYVLQFLVESLPPQQSSRGSHATLTNTRTSSSKQVGNSIHGTNPEVAAADATTRKQIGGILLRLRKEVDDKSNPLLSPTAAIRHSASKGYVNSLGKFECLSLMNLILEDLEDSQRQAESSTGAREHRQGLVHGGTTVLDDHMRSVVNTKIVQEVRNDCDD